MIRTRILGFTLAALLASTAMAAGTLPARSGLPSGKVFGAAPTDDVIFDQGPGTGTLGGCWSNFTEGQNFSDPAPLASGTSVSGIVVFTCIPPTTGTVTFKAVDDNSHAFLYSETGTASSWVDDGAGGYIVTYMLQNPYVVPGGVSVAYGLSGDGFELGQNSVLAPGDGTMAQYAGQVYGFQTTVGDQMFQLLGGGGGTNCDFNGDQRYNAMDLVDFLQACRQGTGGHCAVKLARFTARCGLPWRK